MTGHATEAVAAEWLSQQGLKIVARNWQCRFGEIDIIAQEGKTLVFVEVRARSRSDFGGAAASITHTKREKLLATARQYLTTLKEEPPCRFDAVLFDGPSTQTPEWIKNIFD